MPIDQSIVNQLDQGFGVQIQDMVAGGKFLTELHRGSLMNDGRAVGAAIASNLLQANIPEQGMNLKFADVTPRQPGQAQSETPPPGK